MCGLGVLHDLPTPGRGGANIDHIVVGPGGVTVIDAKAWTGPVRIRASGVWTGRWGHGKELDSIADQVAVVRQTLAAGGLQDAMVRGALCLVNENDGCPEHELLVVHGILVGRPSLVAALACADGGVTADRCHDAFEALQRRLPAKGGGHPPGAELRGAASPPVRNAPGAARKRSAAAPIPEPRAAARSHRRPARRWVRELISGAVSLTLTLCLLVGLGEALRSDPHPDRRASALTADELQSWAPAITQRVQATSPVPVTFERMKTTDARFHVRFRGRGCAIRASVNRWTARSADDVLVVPGRGC